ncbi:hypothetical protein [Marivita sp. XM-24bin2]|jgi:2-methylcitrate dehydratase PrpD|uniref:hypothetical protein n=1 Tax=unclassified Marivita TaxID=2632480 RepID=UPI000D7A0998|nr:hypothetical protein [Marivita sp. XM-24bin2]MCR9107595.1 hypothetical protein [Paracoccaceae bacterium]PWL34860.1 MAG: hypothetical protein DCO97_12185 [Marivita sp. XM-24bin2]
MVRGTCGAVDVHAQSFGDPESQRLAQSMLIRENDQYNAAFPARRIADVTLVLTDGRELQSSPTKALGDPEDPVALETVVANYRSYAGPILGEARKTSIEHLVLNDSDLPALLRLLTQTV